MAAKSIILSVTITRPFEDVYAFLADWNNLSLWASGVGAVEGKISSQEGKIKPLSGGSATLRVCAENEYGVCDHVVCLDNGIEVYVPMRAVRNGDGTDVTITLFQLDGMTDKQFEEDKAHIQKDLATLKRYFET